MSVKNIARNLFVSGVLVLSVGAVCGRPASASGVEVETEAFFKYFMQPVFEKLKEKIEEKLSCIESYGDCLEGVILNSEGNINNCKVQRDKCIDKFMKNAATTLEQDIESVKQDFMSMQEEL